VIQAIVYIYAGIEVVVPAAVHGSHRSYILYDCKHFFQLAETGHSLRGHRMKLFKPRSVLNCRRHSFGQRVIDDWNALPHDVVDSTSVNMFKNRLDGYWEEEN